jgi:predicted CopG family antitoxin
MAPKTMTMSEQAYNALVRMKSKNESFTDAILRLTSSRGNASRLLDFFRNLPESEKLASNTELAMKRIRSDRLGKVSLR